MKDFQIFGCMQALLYVGLYAFYLGLFVWLLYNWRFFDVPGTSRHRFTFFFLLKVAAGILLTLIYTYYYTNPQKADIYRYFTDSQVISPLLFSNPRAWFSIMTGIGIDEPSVFSYLEHTNYFSHPGSDLVTNNTFIIRVNVLLNYLSFTNIYINTLLLNFITFAGLTALYKKLQSYFEGFVQLLYVPLFLLPSLVFWGSGLLKEGLLFACVGFFMAWVIDVRHASRAQTILGILGGMAMLFIKLYVGALAIGLACMFLLPGSLFRFTKARVAIWLTVGIGLLAWSAQYICTALIDKRNEFTLLAKEENAGSYLGGHYIKPTLDRLAALLPEAFVSSVFRPFVWEGGKLFQQVFAVENMLFVLLLAGLLYFFKLPRGRQAHLCVFFLLFALANYMVIGITVPVLGAIVHYRVIAAPFLLLAVLLAVDVERLKQVVLRGQV